MVCGAVRNKLDIIVIILGESHVFPAKLKDGQKRECVAVVSLAPERRPPRA